MLMTASVRIQSGSPASVQGLPSPFVGNWDFQGSVGLTIIEPVPEAVEPILYKIFRRSKVEPRIDCLRSAHVCQNAIWNPSQTSRLGKRGGEALTNIRG